MSISDQEAIAFLKSILRINTTNPPGNEAQLTDYLAAVLRKEGVAARICPVASGRANLVACLPGQSASAKQLLYVGHLDTVPPGELGWSYEPFAAIETADRIYGRGAADMKSGLAAMILAMIDLKRSGCRLGHDLVLVGTAGEEVDCCGAEAFVKEDGMKNVGALVLGEPTDGAIAPVHKGAAWIKIVTFGKTAHSSMPQLGNNAILQMNRFLSKVLRYFDHWQTVPDPLLGLPTCNLSMMQGGSALNMVPDRCISWLDFRLIPGQTLTDVVEPLEQLIRTMSKECPEFKAELEVLSYRMPVQTSASDPFLALAQTVAHQVSPQVKLRGINYYTDASVLLAHRQLPVILYGPGPAEMAHQPDEYVELGKYLSAIKFYKQLAEMYV